MTKNELTNQYIRFYDILKANADLIAKRRSDIGVPVGWIGLVEQIIAEVRTRNETIQIVQVKEKFGGLRFYYDGGSEELHQAIYKIESKGSITCDVCGEPGSAAGDGWLITRCQAHHGFKWPDLDWDTYSRLEDELRDIVNQQPSNTENS